MFGLEQLLAIGLTETIVHRRAASSRLHRIHRAVYSLVPPALLSFEGRLMAAALACGPGAVISHRSAAALLELRASARALIDVSVPGRAKRTHPGIDVHRSNTLTQADTAFVNHIPCTTVSRTLFDLAEVIGRRPLERAFDQAEILEAFDLRALEDQLARNPTRRAATAVRAVLEEHYVGSTPTWSELEECFLACVRAAGVPQPEVNEWIVLPDRDRAIRADFVWRAQRVLLETDGRRTHGTRQAFERDRRDDLRLHAAGWRPLRTTKRRLHREPELVLGTVLTLLRR
ncbi:MAG TPA: DUF559 domain-containing protein [Solirubrobacteraceae bacterium]